MLNMFGVTLIAKEDADARIEEREFAVAMFKFFKIKFGDLEGFGRW